MVKILYVEDNEDNVYMLRRRLERKGFEMVVAHDGEQGIAAAERECPDLILMDLSLPVVDGWAAARHLKGAPLTQAIPIIALSPSILIHSCDLVYWSSAGVLKAICVPPDLGIQNSIGSIF